MKLKDVLEKTTQFFREKGFSSPRLDAEILLAHGLGVERLRLYLDFDRPLSETELALCRELVRRRGQGEPVAYIVGYKDFYRSRFKVAPGVLIPRPETEILVEEAITWIRNHQIDEPQIVDLGTGSGCLGLSILIDLPKARLLAVDRSAQALQIARENAVAQGLADRVIFVEADALSGDSMNQALQQAGFSGIDVLLANPPYIAWDDQRVEKQVHQYEPHEALYADDNGLSALKGWTVTWKKNLKTPGVSIMEMGDRQGADLKMFYTSLGFTEVQVLKDLSGFDRVIMGALHG